MPRPRILPSDETLFRWVGQGMTHQQIADKVSAMENVTVKRATVSAALSRAGLAASQARYADQIPWRVAPEHAMEYPARMLRLLGRRSLWNDLSDRDARRLDSWLNQLEELGAVVAYSPDRGFLYVAKRDGIDGDNGIPIRREVVSEEMIAV